MRGNKSLRLIAGSPELEAMSTPPFCSQTHLCSESQFPICKSEPTADLLGHLQGLISPQRRKPSHQLPQEGVKTDHHLAAVTYRLQVGSFRKDSDDPYQEN